MIQMIRLGALTFALVLAAGVAVAEHHEGGRSGRDAHKWGHGNSHTSSVLKHADELGLDDATWARGRGLALSTSIVALPYYIDSLPVRARRADDVIREVLADQEREP